MDLKPTNQPCLVDASRSPFAKLRPVSVADIKIGDGFWSRWRSVNREVTLTYGYQKLLETGVLANLEAAAGGKLGDFQNMRFADSDLYKWIEAAACTVAGDNTVDADFEKKLDHAVELVAAAQNPDGYIYSFHQLKGIDSRWQNIRNDHELYCAGHLIQAAVARFRFCAKEDLLQVACRFADHIVSVFGPAKHETVPGHPEIEMALVELYRATGTERYLAMARYFVDQRGKGLIGGSSYYQDHAPWRGAGEPAGHAVRQLYLLAGATDVFWKQESANYLMRSSVFGRT